MQREKTIVVQLRNVKDLSNGQLSDMVEQQIRAFVRRGVDRNHLAETDDGRVLFDKELAENDEFDEVIYYPKTNYDYAPVV